MHFLMNEEVLNFEDEISLRGVDCNILIKLSMVMSGDNIPSNIILIKHLPTK
jgi:hypothetical protein